MKFTAIYLTLALLAATSFAYQTTTPSSTGEHVASMKDSTDLGAEEHKLRRYYYNKRRYPVYIIQRGRRSADDETGVTYIDEDSFDLGVDEHKLRRYYRLNYPVSYRYYSKYGRGRRSVEENEEAIAMPVYDQSEDDMQTEEHKRRRYLGRRRYINYASYYPRYYGAHHRYSHYYG